MKHLDLFSGIGGFALAAQWVWGKDHEIVSFYEIEDFPQKVLKKNFPGVPIHDDIKTLDGSKFGTVDLVSGGFPCQRGKEDDRYLWPEMVRIVEESKPRWVVGENVTGFVNMGLEQAAFDLESLGYEVWPLIIPAVAVNAGHQRGRIWIVGYSDSINGRDSKQNNAGKDSQRRKKRQRCDNSAIFKRPGSGHKTLAHANGTGCQKPNLSAKSSRERFDTGQDIDRRFLFREDMPPECPVYRKSDGLSHRMDRHKIKAMGNAIVPQVAAVIFDCIKRIEKQCQ